MSNASLLHGRVPTTRHLDNKGANFFRRSILVGEPSPQKGSKWALLGPSWGKEEVGIQTKRNVGVLACVRARFKGSLIA